MREMLIFDNHFAPEVFLPKLTKERDIIYVNDLILLNVFRWRSASIPMPVRFHFVTEESGWDTVFCRAHAFVGGREIPVATRSVSTSFSAARFLLWQTLCVLAGTVLPEAKDPQWLMAYAKHHSQQPGFILAGAGRGDEGLLSYTIFDGDQPDEINRKVVPGKVIKKSDGIMIALDEGVFVIHPNYMDFSELLDASDLLD